MWNLGPGTFHIPNSQLPIPDSPRRLYARTNGRRGRHPGSVAQPRRGLHHFVAGFRVALGVGGAGPAGHRGTARPHLHQLLARDSGGGDGFGVHPDDRPYAGGAAPRRSRRLAGVDGHSWRLPERGAHAGVLRRVRYLRRGRRLRPWPPMAAQPQYRRRAQPPRRAFHQVEQPGHQPGDLVRNSQPCRGVGPAHSQGPLVPQHPNGSDAGGMAAAARTAPTSYGPQKLPRSGSSRPGDGPHPQQLKPGDRRRLRRAHSRGVQQPGGPCGILVDSRVRVGGAVLRQLPQESPAAPGLRPCPGVGPL